MNELGFPAVLVRLPPSSGALVTDAGLDAQGQVAHGRRKGNLHLAIRLHLVLEDATIYHIKQLGSGDNEHIGGMGIAALE